MTARRSEPRREPASDRVPADLSGTAAVMRAAWRAEQEDAARDAVEQWTHGRTLLDLLLAAMHSGRTVHVDVGGARLSGTVVAVGSDVLALRTADGPADVHLAPSVPLLVRHETAGAGGSRGEAGARTLRGRLLAREDRVATVGTTASPDPLRGRVRAGADHCCVVDADGGETIVPLAAVAYVRWDVT